MCARLTRKKSEKGEMKSLFIVISPFQIISAQNARDELCLSAINEIWILNRHESGTSGYSQIKNVLDKKWSKVVWTTDSTQRGVLRVLKRLLFIITSFAWRYDFVFLGEPRSSSQNAIGKALGGEIWYLDDGTSSIRLIDQVLSGQKVKLYTIFGTRELEKKSQGAVVENKKFFLDYNPPKPVNNEVIFIGQSLSETNILSRAQEIAQIQEVYSNEWRKITYISHRNDHPEKLKIISRTGIQILGLNIPLEIYYKSHPVLPAKIIGWFSTALFTLHKAYPQIEIEFHEINLQRGIPVEAEIRLIYNYARKHGHRVIQTPTRSTKFSNKNE